MLAVDSGSVPCVLSIAGSDPSGGAGIQADIKTISATGSFAAAAITALTVQNTLGVQEVYAVPSSVVARQIAAVLGDLNVRAIKIGMLFNTAIIKAVCAVLEQYPVNVIVIDPVMTAKSGHALLARRAIAALQQYLLVQCSLMTPNIHEAAMLVGRTIANHRAMEQAARELGVRYQTNVLIKGGHLSSLYAADVLYCAHSATCSWYAAPHIETSHTHGTGCTYAAAITSYLAQGYALAEAIFSAKCYLTAAITGGKTWHIGQGIGPVDHFFALPKRRIDEKIINVAT